ncbi:hypothetical protein HanHA300_Chr04g0146331 [Helianthus annuus]|nr:hypothetical protein HanHA300_Chr04g0146331 [Helianthus annuus]KAJ0597882.1 hypothetical protein HanHA89_Chr04g0159701 [Helianthus annuus]KAJ0932341.1 hypothetical protein HanPSC8_Chr04g0172561 [Helianthus annuus]
MYCRRQRVHSSRVFFTFPLYSFIVLFILVLRYILYLRSCDLCVVDAGLVRTGLSVGSTSCLLAHV